MGAAVYASSSRRQNVPFDLELFMSPGLNLTDPSKPLFGEGEAPLSLLPFGSLQAGERAFLRGLTAEEVMTQLRPLQYRYSHRPAGAPVPEGMEGGLTFGSPADGRPTGTRSPVRTPTRTSAGPPTGCRATRPRTGGCSRCTARQLHAR